MKLARLIATGILCLGFALTGVPLHSRADAGQAAAPANPRVINISAKRYAFTPRAITLKKGETVTIRLTSEDRIHGFYSKPLKVDELIEPGKTTELTITPAEVGTFTTICDHFCGAGHGNMNMTITVE
jgi:cytochrome c oxidase subunit 2